MKKSTCIMIIVIIAILLSGTGCALFQQPPAIKANKQLVKFNDKLQKENEELRKDLDKCQKRYKYRNQKYFNPYNPFYDFDTKNPPRPNPNEVNHAKP